ncbi:MAG TPA: precorrin-6A reductase [Deltaproteobacteria bacterium]|nr:precorrin-6A reductase [Deltaproteobacteria bacterium]HQB39262.1 precorrin-6A reductase [Deltaproteobacteria bacterium]
MILLMGGTSETAGIAWALAEQGGWQTLISTATDAPLELPQHPLLEKRQGRLDRHELAALIRQRGIRLVVDATHPFAVIAHESARAAAAEADIPCLRWERQRDDYAHEGITFVDSHGQAAELAARSGINVLLTTGSRNLLPYVMAFQGSTARLYARVLPHAESMRACEEAQLPAECVIAERGPFSVEQTMALIIEKQIGLLVSKDSGAAGGVPEKLEAARRCGCRVIMIRRPESIPGVSVLDDLVFAVRMAFGQS